VRVLSKIAIASCAVFLAGCSAVPGNNPTGAVSNPSQGTALYGKVYGGQAPIVGAKVYLFAANPAGYGTPSVSLLADIPGTTTKDTGDSNYYVTTQSGGTFSISGDFTCPSAGTQVYLYSIGGNAGQGSNVAAGLMAGLGSCGLLSSSQTVIINEVSTVATAYAVAGFATDALHVSSSGTAQALTGIANAFSTIPNLESLSMGTALTATPAGNGAPPYKEIDTLANILASCINSTPPSSSQCTTLFTNAENGSTAPSETATAAINIAHNPGSNIASLYGLGSASGPFQPALTAAPNDFTVAITYSGGGLDGSGRAPEGIAVDASGNVWVPNSSSNTVSEFKSNGVVLSNQATPCNSYYCGAGLSEPTSVAIDIYGNAWVANYKGTSISEFNASGYAISGPPGFEGSGLNSPYGIAIDDVNRTWVANFGGNNLSEFTANGTALSGQNGYASGVLDGPAGIAADTAGNVWSVNYVASQYLLVETNSSGAQTPDPSGYGGGGLKSPYGVAIDGSGNVWVTNQVGGSNGQGSLSEFGTTGCSGSTYCAQSGSTGFSGGGIDGPFGVAVDGLGNIWTANRFGDSISEFSSSGTAISPAPYGYYSSGINEPYGIAVDPSGNVWVANDNNGASLTEFVGAAAPVVTPLSVGVELQELGARP
jgi:streptogramin lyase